MMALKFPEESEEVEGWGPGLLFTQTSFLRIDWVIRSKRFHGSFPYELKIKLKGQSFLTAVNDSIRHMQSLTKFLRIDWVIGSKSFHEYFSYYELKLKPKLN